MSTVITTAAELRAFIAPQSAPVVARSRRGSKQVWAVGSTVNVGFVRGLTITARTEDGWLLRDASGRRYAHSHDFGLERLDYAA